MSLYNALDKSLRGIDAEELSPHIEDWRDSDLDDLYNELLVRIKDDKDATYDIDSHIRDAMADIDLQDLHQMDIKAVIRNALKTYADICVYVSEYVMVSRAA